MGRGKKITPTEFKRMKLLQGANLSVEMTAKATGRSWIVVKRAYDSKDYQTFYPPIEMKPSPTQVPSNTVSISKQLDVINRKLDTLIAVNQAKKWRR